MKNIILIFAVLAIYPLKVAAESPEVLVTAKAPYGAARSGAEMLEITAAFNQPMVPLGSAEQNGEICPLEVYKIEDPQAEGYTDTDSASLEKFQKKTQLRGRCRWRGTQTVVFEPLTPLEQSSLYAARIAGGFKSAVSGKVLASDSAWFFETERLRLDNSRPYTGQSWQDINSGFIVSFTTAVTPTQAEAFVELIKHGPRNHNATIKIKVSRPELAELKKSGLYYNHSVDNFLLIKPLRAMSEGTSYTLRFKSGLKPTIGALGLAEAKEINFTTYNRFDLVSRPAVNCLPNTLRIGFSNPVNEKQLVDNLTADFALPKAVDRGYYNNGYQDATAGIVYFDLPDHEYKPGKTYRFKVSKELKDIFGNKLGEDKNIEFIAPDYCSKFEMQGGFGILESYLPLRHPLYTVNNGPVKLTKGIVAEDNFIPFYQNGMNRELVKNKVTTDYDPNRGERNIRVNSFLDYSELFPEKRGGFVFAEVNGIPGRTFSAIDNVTKIGLTFKISQDSCLIWTTFLKTGKPAVKTPVEIRNHANKVLWTGVTNTEGFADAPGWVKLGITDWKTRPELWLLARPQYGPAIISSAWTQGVESWRFGINYEYYSQAKRYGAALFTERGVYRPGETVEIKGLGRLLHGPDWGALDLKTVKFSIADSRGNSVYAATVPVSSLYSSFDMAYRIAENAPTGLWQITVTEPKEDEKEPLVEEDESESEYYYNKKTFSVRENFRVEEFKPAVFEVKAKPLTDQLLAGDLFKAVVEGWYLFGAPMSDSVATWSLRLDPAYYTPPGYEDFYFTACENEYSQAMKLSSDAGVLDEKGRLSLEAYIPKELHGCGAYNAVLEAGVTDPERQNMFGRGRALVHKANLYLGIKASGGFIDTGKKWSADIVAVRPDGTTAKGVQATASLIKRQWLSSMRAGLGGRLEWVSEQKDTVVSSGSFAFSGSTVPWAYTPNDGGYYIFTVSGKDEAGRAAKSSFSFYVFGGGDAWWSRSDSDIIELLPEKKEYKPGETARILVKSPYDEVDALITVEREGILDRWVQHLKGGADFINLPIKEKYLPNIYVGAILVKGRAGEQKYDEDGGDLSKPQAKFGYTSLSVNPEGRRLKVIVQSDKPNYRPGGEVELSLKITDESGLPASAEAAVFVVDEGVLTLTGYGTPDIFSSFYGARPLNVTTVDSRPHIIGQRNYGEKGEARGGGGGASLSGIDLRSKFTPTAYWNPSVITGSDGSAKVSFKLPDNLSRFRLMAVAGTGKRFGSGESSLTVSKPLMLRPSLPRLARIGDEFDCGAVLHNYSVTESGIETAVEAAGNAVVLTGEKQRTVTVASGKAMELVWKCKAEKPGITEFLFRAKAGSETDGLKWSLPVKVQEPVEYAATSGATNDKATEAILRPYPGAEGELSLSLSASALSGVQEGARFLLDYPHGCLEQRLSRAIPVLVGSALIEEFKLGDIRALKTATEKIFERLGDFQHASGGFCYWTGYCYKPDPYLTGYALEAAALAKKEGYKIADAVLAKAVSWFSAYLSSTKTDWAYPYSMDEELTAKSYAVYALALNAALPTAYFDQLSAKREQLSALAKAYLLKAAVLSKADTVLISNLRNSLLGHAKYAAVTMHFEDDKELPWLHDSSVVTTAASLDALLLAGGFNGDEKALKWLTAERKIAGHWRTTQENSWALRVFQNYYRRYEKEIPDFTAVVSKEGGQAFAKTSFKGRDLAVKSFQTSFKELFGAGQDARLEFSKSGPGRLYYAARMSFAPLRPDAARSEGFEISKTVKPMDGDRDFKAGARAIVTITVKTKQDRIFTAVNDPVPAGFEIVNTAFAVESSEKDMAVAQNGERGGYWGEFERSEKYDDRIGIYADYLTAGTHTYSYVVQATTPGTYYAPSATVECMYEPEVFGRTAAETVTIKR